MLVSPSYYNYTDITINMLILTVQILSIVIVVVIGVMCCAFIQIVCVVVDEEHDIAVEINGDDN
jgi:hypothetical protein